MHEGRHAANKYESALYLTPLCAQSYKYRHALITTYFDGYHYTPPITSSYQGQYSLVG